MRIHGMFDDRYRGIATEQPQQWNTTPYTGLPKTREAETPGEYRWIAITDVVKQWYNRTWRPFFRVGKRVVENVQTWGI